MTMIPRYALTAMIFACGFLGAGFSMPPNMREAPRLGIPGIVG